MSSGNEILRFPAVRALVGASRSSVFRWEREGKFPQRRQLGANSVGWHRREIEAWIESRAAVGRHS